MLREAIDLIRQLFEGERGELRGRPLHGPARPALHPPRLPPPIWVAASGARTARFAGEVADGLIGLAPDPSLVAAFETAGGQGKPRVAQLHVCWATDDGDAPRAPPFGCGRTAPSPVDPHGPGPTHASSKTPPHSSTRTTSLRRCSADPTLSRWCGRCSASRPPASHVCTSTRWDRIRRAFSPSGRSRGAAPALSPCGS